MKTYLVEYRARNSSGTWIKQTAHVKGDSADYAKMVVQGQMVRAYQAGSWFTDWRIDRATETPS